MLCYPESHEKWNTNPKGNWERKQANKGEDVDWNKKRRKTYAVIFLSAQRSWGCIFWATDKQTGLESLLSRRAWLGHPAVGGGAFRLPFSIIPRWETLWTPKEIKQNVAEHQVDPTERLIFENFFEDSNHRCSLLMLSVFLKLCHTKNWGCLCDCVVKCGIME